LIVKYGLGDGFLVTDVVVERRGAMVSYRGFGFRGVIGREEWMEDMNWAVFLLFSSW